MQHFLEDSIYTFDVVHAEAYVRRPVGSTANVHSRFSHVQTQQHATNAAVMCAGSAENVHSRHRLHIEKMSGEHVLLAAQRMCTAAATSGIVCHGTGGAVCWQRRECAQPPTC